MTQVKDIPTTPLLERLWLINKAGHWATRFEGFPNSLCLPDIPDNLYRAKMRNLIKRGLVYGCPCGCRGDFVKDGVAAHKLDTWTKANLTVWGSLTFEFTERRELERFMDALDHAVISGKIARSAEFRRLLNE